jgi:3-phosphoshikimate 1-carboxyvinyltransferase
VENQRPVNQRPVAVPSEFRKTFDDQTVMSADSIAIQPCGPLHASIRPPGSKSITNRALICAALAEGNSRLTGALDSEDTRVMCDALRQLKLDVVANNDHTILDVTGCGGDFGTEPTSLFVANSGTSIRFLTAMVATGSADIRLDGIARMRERPIGDLLDALNQLGAQTRCENDNGCPPVVVAGRGLPGGVAEIHGGISSQYLSGLLMAAPYAQQDVTLKVAGELVSKPYVEMTLRVMKSFGVNANSDQLQFFEIPGTSKYQGCQYAIEPDASAASYFWAAAAICGGQVTVEGLSKAALQGDVEFCDCLEQMGCEVQYDSDSITVKSTQQLRGIEVDMNAISDTVQTLAAVALFADGPTTITNVGHIRHKETDRIGDLARELRKFGARVDETEDSIRVHPAPLSGAVIDTYNDHRMAMSLALVGLRVPGVVISDPGCTVKTYPNFFADLKIVVSS